jgi:tRNA pseudouridine-54 N-methylase
MNTQEEITVLTANPKRLTATANRLILAPDERSLQVDLVRALAEADLEPTKRRSPAVIQPRSDIRGRLMTVLAAK